MLVEHFTIEGQGRPRPDPGPTRLARGQADPGPGSRASKNGLDPARPGPRTVYTWQVRGFKGCQWVQKTLLVSTTANTVTSVTQTHLKLQENHPKFLWARQRPLLPSKSVRSQFFFSAFCQTPPLQPLVRDPRSATPLTRICSIFWRKIIVHACIIRQKLTRTWRQI